MSRQEAQRGRRIGGIEFHHPGAFWFGAAAVTAGVLLMLPMYIGARDDPAGRYHLAGQSPDAAMWIGMILSIVGIAVMKPTTLAFVVPGMAKEYGLRSPANLTATVPVAWLPLAGITGTVLGSFLWGFFGDKIGRRASILLAAVLFIATSACGSMPHYTWNFATCFIMGLGVGGMLPITFALMAETIPARHRGWLMVLIGGDVAGAYILTSWLASSVGAANHFGWRILWLLGLPTGVLLIVLNRWIPESPRFLLQHGRDQEAREVMHRYGAVVVEDQAS